jgi:hypothetical protein
MRRISYTALELYFIEVLTQLDFVITYRIVSTDRTKRLSTILQRERMIESRGSYRFAIALPPVYQH